MNERTIAWREYGETVVHPLALSLTLAMGIWLLLIRRDKAVLPIILVAVLIPLKQRIVVATLDFDMTRILILFGWTRIVLKGEYRNYHWHRLDFALILWLCSGTLIHVLRDGTFGAFVYRLGLAFNAAGIYFMLRVMLRSATDVLHAIRVFAFVAAMVGGFMILENITGRNIFSIFGGVKEMTAVRDGRLRCMGAFSHPIMAGSFGAGLFPIMLMLTLGDKQRRVAPLLGLFGAAAIAVTSASSGPALALLSGLFGCMMYVVRNHMRPIRWVTVAVLTIVHFSREAPVWHLIGRASDLIGGTGYHRVRLISGFVDNTRDWFLVGVRSTAHWGWGLQDLTNQFVFEGVTGGFLTLFCFLMILTIAFRSAARLRLRARAATALQPSMRRTLQLLAWGLGVSLATHCVSWISVSYFGQMNVVLYMLYAFIAAGDGSPELAATAVPGRGAVSAA